jgi:hypothetical protein
MSNPVVAPVAVMQRPQRIPIYRLSPRRQGDGSVYAVPKMDCPSEERMIRLALNGFEEIWRCPSTCRTAG